MKKYEGINKEGFKRDLFLLNEWKDSANPTDEDFKNELVQLGNDYGIENITEYVEFGA